MERWSIGAMAIHTDSILSQYQCKFQNFLHPVPQVHELWHRLELAAVRFNSVIPVLQYSISPGLQEF